MSDSNANADEGNKSLPSENSGSNASPGVEASTSVENVSNQTSASGASNKGKEVNPFPGIRLHTGETDDNTSFPGVKMHIVDDADADEMGSSSCDEEEAERHVSGVQSEVVSLQGARRYMEDTFVRIDNLEEHLPQVAKKLAEDLPCGRRISVHAVYDGHGGHRASYYLRNHLHQNILQDPSFTERRIERALHNAFIDTDRSLLERAEAENWKAGSTAVAVVLIDDYLICANTGDSELVLGRRRRRRRRVHSHADSAVLRGEHVHNPPWAALRCPKSPGHDAVVLSSKHQLNDEAERKRVISLGGVITGRRLFGDLAVSRGFGDREYKKPRAEADYITVEPALKTVLLGDQDEFFVMASDGLWDVVSHQEAVDLISAYVEKKAASHRPLASRLEPAVEIFNGQHPYTDDAGAMPAGLAAENAKENTQNTPAAAAEKETQEEEEESNAEDKEVQEKEETEETEEADEASSEKDEGEKETDAGQDSTSTSTEEKKEEGKTETPLSASEEGKSKSTEETEMSKSAPSSDKPTSTSSKRAMLTRGGGGGGKSAKMRGLAALGGGGGGCGGKGNIRALVRNKKPKFQAAKLNLLPIEEMVSPDTTAAAKLANLALERGSKDNITVLIVYLNWEESDD